MNPLTKTVRAEYPGVSGPAAAQGRPEPSWKAWGERQEDCRDAQGGEAVLSEAFAKIDLHGLRQNETV